MSIHIVDGAQMDHDMAVHILRRKHGDNEEAIFNDLRKTRIETKRKEQNGDSDSCVYPGFVIRRKS